MDTAELVFDLARVLLDDPEQDWATDDYLRPFLNLAWRGFANDLGAVQMGWNERVEMLSELAAGTRNLAAFLLPGQPLAAMWQPVDLWQRPAGSSDSDWQRMRRVAALPPDLVQQIMPGLWEYREGDIWFPPGQQSIDLQIRFEEIFPALADATQPLRIAGAGNVLSYSVAALVARSRGTRTMAADYAGEAQRQTGLLLLRLGKEMQRVRVRQRPYGGAEG